MAEREPLDLAILDINRNGEDVFPVADVLVRRNIPFILATGYSAVCLCAPYRDRPTLHKP